MRYRRADAAGASYFFTVNLAERKRDLLVRHIDTLRQAVRLSIGKRGWLTADWAGDKDAAGRFGE